MVLLYFLLTYLSMGVVGLFITYHNPKSPFYGELDSEAICMGLLLAPGCLLAELFSLIGRAFGGNRVIFKRKAK